MKTFRWIIRAESKKSLRKIMSIIAYNKLFMPKARK